MQRVVQLQMKNLRSWIVAWLQIDKGTRTAAKGHRSMDAMAGVLAWIVTLARNEFPSITFEKKTVLEIGTGKFFAHALIFSLLGCREVISIDINRQLIPAALRLAAESPVLARRFLSPLISHDQFMSRLRAIQETQFDLKRLSQLGIHYIAPFDLMHSVQFDGRFDFVFSYTVLEHIESSRAAGFLAESILKLVPGGVCIHFVDLEDHADVFNAPFEFLTEGTPWREEYCAERGNRIRYSSWRKAAESIPGVDWRIIPVTVRHDVPLPATIDQRVSYTDEDDARTTAILIVGKRI